jgi:hypothetical protein
VANSGGKGVSNEKLMEINRRWVQEKQEELRQKEDELNKLQEECIRIRQELEPIETWLARMENREQSPGTAGESGEDEVVVQEKEELRGDRLRDEVVGLLREVYPDMLYYRVILKRLQEKGYEIAGKDPGLNLIAHISKDKRIKRGDKRGIYGLDESYLDTCESGGKGS